MTALSISIHNAAGELLAHASQADTECAPKAATWLNLVYTADYAEGDTITVTARRGAHLLLQLDDALDPALVYATEETYRFIIPFAEKRLSYNPKTFNGSLHLLRVRYATEDEIASYRNLAFNSHDTAANASFFPHASANIETRGESVFAARNAINGNTANESHGAWPYESWGINKDPNAELHLDFGRAVTVDRLVLVTRADFPHDNYWKQATVLFSDGSTLSLPMQKSREPHVFTFEPKTITALTLKELLKDEDAPSPFPALSQIEVYGHEAAL
ncbi:MAG: carbohydrate-binding protein [Treponema sp.]|nr:carbohydrate-binding protein [Treponema sp.]